MIPDWWLHIGIVVSFCTGLWMETRPTAKRISGFGDLIGFLMVYILLAYIWPVTLGCLIAGYFVRRHKARRAQEVG